MKKFRGKKRYYRNLLRENVSFTLELGGANDWYDFWHRHFDWRGLGNNGGRARNEHIKSAFTTFLSVLEQLKEYKKPYQVWLSFSEHESDQDALYFHTPNPNENNFPYLFEDYEWGVEIPALLSPFIKKEFEIGVMNYAGDTWYSVRVQKKSQQDNLWYSLS